MPSSCPDDFPSYGEMIRAFLDNLAAVHAATPPVKDDPPGPTSIFHARRLDYDRIVELVPPGASVLDLGCGTGRSPRPPQTGRAPPPRRHRTR